MGIAQAILFYFCTCNMPQVGLVCCKLVLHTVSLEGRRLLVANTGENLSLAAQLQVRMHMSLL